LLGRVSQDFGDLVSTQVQLAKVEIKDEVRRAAKGAGFIGGGAVAALLATLLLSFALAWGLAEAMPAWLGFLIVGLVWAALAAVLALRGRQQLHAATPVLPETKESLKEDVQWAKHQKS
jgi:MFS family permease